MRRSKLLFNFQVGSSLWNYLGNFLRLANYHLEMIHLTNCFLYHLFYLLLSTYPSIRNERNLNSKNDFLIAIQTTQLFCRSSLDINGCHASTLFSFNSQMATINSFKLPLSLARNSVYRCIFSNSLSASPNGNNALIILSTTKLHHKTAPQNCRPTAQSGRE